MAKLIRAWLNLRPEGQPRSALRCHGSRPLGAGAGIGLGLLVMAGLGAEDQRPDASPRTAPLAVVLQVQRPSDADLVFFSGGEQHKAIVRTGVVHLRTPHGFLPIPTSAVAGLELAAGRGGQDTVVTIHRDYLQGFIENSEFQVTLEGSQPERSIRRERLRRLVFHVRPEELTLTASTWLIQLRDGCFIHGRLTAGQVRVADTGADFPLRTEAIRSLRFHDADAPTAELDLSAGGTLRVSTATEDLEFLADCGVALRFYHAHVQEVRPAGVPTPGMSQRLGSPVQTTPSLPPGGTGPDPGIIPVEGMKWIGPGEFVMGSPTDELGRDLDEGPLTKVVIPQGFWVGVHEVTQAEYETVLNLNPSQYLGENRRPVEKVNWQEAMDYCRRLTERERAAGRLSVDYAYRLPTEAEWEYACRAGTQTRFSFGDDPARTQINDYAWHGGNSDSAPHPVGLKQPNPWGLHDLHGNVLEWCLDEWKGALPGATHTNRVGLPSGTLRVARGGSWLYEARFSRSANRDSYGLLNRCSDLGFRLALSRLTPADPAPEPGP